MGRENVKNMQKKNKQTKFVIVWGRGEISNLEGGYSPHTKALKKITEWLPMISFIPRLLPSFYYSYHRASSVLAFTGGRGDYQGERGLSGEEGTIRGRGD